MALCDRELVGDGRRAGRGDDGNVDVYQVSEDGEIRPGEGGTSAAVPHVATYIKSGYGGEEESQA